MTSCCSVGHTMILMSRNPEIPESLWTSISWVCPFRPVDNLIRPTQKGGVTWGSHFSYPFSTALLVNPPLPSPATPARSPAARARCSSPVELPRATGSARSPATSASPTARHFPAGHCPGTTGARAGWFAPQLPGPSPAAGSSSPNLAEQPRHLK